jgi:hypothetical protein
MMEAARTSETLVNFYQTTRRYNPEDSNLHTHCRENLKSYIRKARFDFTMPLFKRSKTASPQTAQFLRLAKSIILYRVFHLKHNPNKYTWTPSHTKRCINGNIEFLQPYPVVASDALLEICTAVIWDILSLDEHLSQTNTFCASKFCYQSLYCFLVLYFIVRMSIAKCFTNGDKRCRCEVMFENEHTFCSWIHHVHICTAFAQLVWPAA